MFIIEKKENEETKLMLKKIKKIFANVPAHFELLSTVNPKRFLMFMDEIFYLMTHKDINNDFFAFLRVYISNKEDFKYCKEFNTNLLIHKKYSIEVINNVKFDIQNIPLDSRHKALALCAIKAVYDANNFTKKDIEYLKSLSWDDASIYDAIDHACFLFKNSKILKAYLKD